MQPGVLGHVPPPAQQGKLIVFTDNSCYMTHLKMVWGIYPVTACM
jgi:hypothetical protein